MEAAVSAGEIATAMQSVNYSAQMAGISIDTLIGILTTNQEITQKGPEQVGNAWRTIVARMNNVKAGKFIASANEISSDSYNEEEWTALNDVETVLRGIGVDLRSSAGEFKSSEVILGEIANKWNSLNTVQQSAIANAMAGTRQRENFIATMSNWDQVQAYAELASDSLGQAAKKMEAYTDSLEATKNRLQAALESFATSGFITFIQKTFVKLETYFAENGIVFTIALGAITLLNLMKGNLLTSNHSLQQWERSLRQSKTIIESLYSPGKRGKRGGGGTQGSDEGEGDGETPSSIISERARFISSKVGMAFGGLGFNGIFEALEDFSNLGNWKIKNTPLGPLVKKIEPIGTLIGGTLMETVGKAVPDMISNGGKFKESLVKAATGLKGDALAAAATGTLGKVLSGFSIAGLLIAFAGTVYKVIKGRIDKQTQEAANAFQEATNAYTTKKTASANIKKYFELAKGVNSIGQNISLTANDYDEFLKISKELSDAFPELVDSTDNLGNKFILLKDVSKTVSEKINEVNQNIDDSETNAEKLSTNSYLQQKNYEEARKKYVEYLNAKEKFENGTSKEFITNKQVDDYIQEGMSLSDFTYNTEIGKYSLNGDAQEKFTRIAENKVKTLEEEWINSGANYINEYFNILNLVMENSKLKPKNWNSAQTDIAHKILGDSNIINRGEEGMKDPTAKLEEIMVALEPLITSQSFILGYESLPTNYVKLGEYGENLNKELAEVNKWYANVDLSNEEKKEYLKRLGDYQVKNGQVVKDNIYTRMLEDYAPANFANWESVVSNMSYTQASNLIPILREKNLRDAITDTETLNTIARLNGPTADNKYGWGEYNQQLKEQRKLFSKNQEDFNNQWYTDNLNYKDIDELKEQLFSQYAGTYSKQTIDAMAEAIDTYKEHVNDILNSELDEEEKQKRIAEFKNNLNATIDTSLLQQELSSKSQETKLLLAEQFSDVDLGEDGLISNFKELKDVMDSLVSSFDKLKEAQKEYAAAGHLSWQTALDLIAADESYIDVMSVENGQITLNSNAQEIMAEAKLIAAKAGLEQLLVEKQKRAQEILDILTGKSRVKTINGVIKAINAHTDSTELDTASLMEHAAAEKMNWVFSETGSQNVAEYLMAAKEQKYWSGEIERIKKEGPTDKTVDTSVYDLSSAEIQSLKDEFNRLMGMDYSVYTDLFADNISGAISPITDEVINSLSGGSLKVLNTMLSDINDALENGTATDLIKSKIQQVNDLIDGVQKLRDIIEMINRDFAEMILTQNGKIKGITEAANAMESGYVQVKKVLLEREQKLLEANLDGMKAEDLLMLNADGITNLEAKLKGLEGESFNQTKEWIDELMKVYQEIQEINKETDKYRVELMQIMGHVTDEQIAELRKMAEDLTLSEREHLEAVKAYNEALVEQINLKKQLAEFEKDILDLEMEYYKGRPEGEPYLAAMQKSEKALEQKIAAAKELVSTIYNQQYQYAVEELHYGSAAAEAYAQESAEYQQAMLGYVQAQKELSDLYMQDFENKIAALERRMAELEKLKPNKWASSWFSEENEAFIKRLNLDKYLTPTQEKDVIHRMETYYNQMQKSYEDVAKTALDTLNKYAGKLTDDQITQITQKYNDAIKNIRDNALQLTQDIQDYQESVYSALVNEVNRYKDQLSKQKEMVEDYYDKEIDKLNDKNEAIDRTNKLLELQQRLLDAQQEKERVNFKCPKTTISVKNQRWLRPRKDI